MNDVVVEGLRKARALVAEPGGWTQGVGLQGGWKPAPTRSGGAHCLLSALGHVGLSVYGAEYAALLAVAPPETVGHPLFAWNDAPERAQQDVVDLFTRAIEHLTGQPEFPPAPAPARQKEPANA